MHDGIDSEMKYFSSPKMEARETNDWDDKGKAVRVMSKGFHHFGEMECELLGEGGIGGSVTWILRTEPLEQSAGNVTGNHIGKYERLT